MLAEKWKTDLIPVRCLQIEFVDRTGPTGEGLSLYLELDPNLVKGDHDDYCWMTRQELEAKRRESDEEWAARRTSGHESL